MQASNIFTSPLELFNSLGRRLQVFVPMEPERVRMYSCGPTVYHYVHVGNLRAYIFNDTLRRILQLKGFDVLHAMNITDVGHLTSDTTEGQDKMEVSATREGKSVWDIAEHYTNAFRADLRSLNILEPSIWCKASEHIEEMITFAQNCERRGHTYLLEDGLYFDTSTVSGYGQLALLDIEGQEEGARVAPRIGKRNSSDFVLWRRSPINSRRLMEWHSPWGTGAPGWHLECSTMSMKYLGSIFDIHTGGVDLRQIHHCNEIAQNQACVGIENAGAKIWMHNDFLRMGASKMSKSSGDFVQLIDLRDHGIHPAVYRYFCLMANYRVPLDYSMEALVAAKVGLSRLLKRIQQLLSMTSNLEWIAGYNEYRYSRGGAFSFVRDILTNGISSEEHKWVTQFDRAISNDLNTPQVLALMSSLISEQNIPDSIRLKLIALYDLVLGLQLLELKSEDLNIRPKSALINDTEISQLLHQRELSRIAKDYQQADTIRKELEKSGVLAMDGQEGTSWEWIPQ